MTNFSTCLTGTAFRPSFLLILFSMFFISCGSDPQEDVSSRQEENSTPDRSIDQSRETQADGRVEQGVERMIEAGDRYAAVLQKLHSVDDVEEHRQELVKVFATMKELENSFRDQQQKITARLDTNGRSVELNNRLRSELMRIAGDSALATRLAELRTSVTGVPIQ